MELTAQALRPLLECAARLDLAEPQAARAALEEAFPVGGPFVQDLAASLRAAVERGEICQQGAPPVQYSRVFKAEAASLGFSADAVLMSAPGPLHEHPNGEIDLCFAESGQPRFDGHPQGWVVYGPGSRHVPAVRDGTMLILYLLPGGAIRFLKS